MPKSKHTWTATDVWTDLCGQIQKKKHERKLRLFGCACCRRVWDLLIDSVSREAIEAAEKFADGLITMPELVLHRKAAHRVVQVNLPGRDPGTARQWAANAAEMVTHATLKDAYSTSARRAAQAVERSEARSKAVELRMQSILFRDIFDNVPMPVPSDASWRTSTVLSLAEQMYDTRDFSAMPILADALQDAGCTDATILSHCRGPGPHVRGCWVVDLVLGKQ